MTLSIIETVEKHALFAKVVIICFTYYYNSYTSQVLQTFGEISGYLIVKLQ